MAKKPKPLHGGLYGRRKNLGEPITVPHGYVNTPSGKPVDPNAALDWANIDKPQGPYDPAIDIAAGQAQRGYGNLQQDYGYSVDPNTGQMVPTGRYSQRAQTDYNLGLEQFKTQTSDLGRTYDRLAASQAGRAAQAGALPGAGVLNQQATARAGNYQHDLAPIERGQATLGLNYGRTVEDYQTNLSRGGTELGNTLIGLGKQAFWSAGPDLTGGAAVAPTGPNPYSPAKKKTKPKDIWGGLRKTPWIHGL